MVARRHITLTFALVLALVGPATSFADDEPTTTESGLKVTLLAPGEGEPAAAGDRVTIHYVAWLSDGTQFGSTHDQGRTFSTKYEPKWLIPGLFEGLAFLKLGGKARFEMPWQIAYGERGKPSSTRGAPPVVPPKTDVVYEVELVEIVRKPVFHSLPESEWIDILPGLRYAVLKAGEGEVAKGDERVRLRYTLWNVHKSLVQSTFGDRKRLDGVLAELRLAERSRRPGERGELHGEKMLPAVVSLMKPGEVVWVEASAAHTWGADPTHDEVPPNTTTWWELELLDVTDLPSFEDGADGEMITLPSGLKYQVIQKGYGRKARKGRENEVHYVGWLTNGTLFDTSLKTGGAFRTNLTSLIKGWIEGIALMREGDVFRFTVPGDLAYGTNGFPPTIAPNATLVFWVECLKVW